MGKKRLRSKYISQGQGQSVSQKTLNAIKSDKGGWETAFHVLKAWVGGSNPWVTIDNPNKSQTNMKKIRVRLRDLKGGTYKSLEKNNYVMN